MSRCTNTVSPACAGAISATRSRSRQAMSVNTGNAVPSTFGGMAIVRCVAVARSSSQITCASDWPAPWFSSMTTRRASAETPTTWPGGRGTAATRRSAPGPRVVGANRSGVATIGAWGAPPSNTRSAVRPATWITPSGATATSVAAGSASTGSDGFSGSSSDQRSRRSNRLRNTPPASPEISASRAPPPSDSARNRPRRGASALPPASTTLSHVPAISASTDNRSAVSRA